MLDTLNKSTEWLIGSLIHKFRGSDTDADRDEAEGDFIKQLNAQIPKDFSAKGNLFVFVDEAHRTQSGKMHDAMKELLPGAMFIGFSSWVNTCYTGLTTCNTSDNTAELDTDLSAESSYLQTVLTELNRRAGLDLASGHQLRVLVTDYYKPFSDSHTNCIDVYNSGYWPSITTGDDSDLSWLEAGLNDLNYNIDQQVIYAQDNDTHLDVSLVDLSGDYGGTDVVSGHELCTSDPWVYGPSINYPSWSDDDPGTPVPLHPTTAGQRAIYDEVMAVLG